MCSNLSLIFLSFLSFSSQTKSIAFVRSFYKVPVVQSMTTTMTSTTTMTTTTKMTPTRQAVAALGVGGKKSLKPKEKKTKLTDKTADKTADKSADKTTTASVEGMGKAGAAGSGFFSVSDLALFYEDNGIAGARANAVKFVNAVRRGGGSVGGGAGGGGGGGGGGASVNDVSHPDVETSLDIQMMSGVVGAASKVETSVCRVQCCLRFVCVLCFVLYCIVLYCVVCVVLFCFASSFYCVALCRWLSMLISFHVLLTSVFALLCFAGLAQ
jgi:hypothetical protein